jgi:hypothetical protein
MKESQVHIQVVNFNLNVMTDSEYCQASEQEFGPAFANVDGLLAKVWLRDPATNTYGGVYAWKDKQAMTEFAKSDLFKAFVTSPNFVNITSRDYEVMEQPTRATRGSFG